MATNWRVVVALAVPAVVVALFLVVPPADLGPWISAAVVGGAVVALTLTRFRTSVTARVAMALTFGLFGVLAGFLLGLGLHIGPGQHQLSRTVSAIGVPAGFEKTDAYGCDTGPFCPETVYTRDYVGTGSVAAVTEEMVARMRKGCFKDAAASPGTPGLTPAAFVVSGTCESRDTRMGVGIGVEQTGPHQGKTSIRFSASGL